MLLVDVKFSKAVCVCVLRLVFLESSELTGNYPNILESTELDSVLSACTSMCVCVCARDCVRMQSLCVCVFAKTDLMFKDKPLKRQ